MIEYTVDHYVRNSDYIICAGFSGGEKGQGCGMACDAGLSINGGDQPYNVMQIPWQAAMIDPEAFCGIPATIFSMNDEQCHYIGGRAFANCPNFKVLLFEGIADDLQIADDSFKGSPNLFILTYSEKLGAWAESHNIPWIECWGD